MSENKGIRIVNNNLGKGNHTVSNSHDIEPYLSTCDRSGELGASKWPDTKLVLTDKNHNKFKRELQNLEERFTGSDLIRKGAEFIIQGLKEDCGVPTDGNENFKDTPNRVARLYMEMFGGQKYLQENIDEILSTSFPGDYSEMILVKDIKTFGLCPHHLLPVEYSTSVAYIPNSGKKGGRVLGISKLPRLVQLLTSRPVLQEQACFDVANILHTKLKAKGSICFMEGRHFCMAMRGTEQTDALTTTNSVTGIFRDPKEGSRAEFLAALNKK